MELIGLGFVIMVLAIVFRKPLRRGNTYLYQVVDTNINEEQPELIERSMAAYQDVKDKYGDNFLTPEEVFDLLTKKKKPNVQK